MDRPSEKGCEPGGSALVPRDGGVIIPLPLTASTALSFS